MSTIAAPVADMAASAGSFDADLSSTIDSALDLTGGDTPATEAQAEPQAPQDAPQQDPAPTEPEPLPVAAEVPVDPNNPYQLTPDGTGYVVPKDELPQFQGYKEYAEAVQQRFPTPSDAEAAYAEASDFRAILNDYQYGQTKDVDAILEFFSGANAQDPMLQQSMRQGFERMAMRIPEVLAKINPQAHAAHVTNLMQSHEEALYNKWAQTGSEADKQAYQQFAWGRSGQYKTEVQAIDPAKAYRDQLTKQQEQIQQRETQLLDRDWQSFNKSNVDGPKWSEFDAELNKTLDPIKASYAPEVFAALKDSVKSQILEKLKGDYEWARNQNNTRTQIQKGYEQSWRNRQPADFLTPRVKAYQADFMSRVRMALPSIAKPLINKAAARPAAVQQKAPPQQSPQAPTQRAANGQFQKPNPSDSLMDNPEFSAIFRI